MHSASASRWLRGASRSNQCFALLAAIHGARLSERLALSVDADHPGPESKMDDEKCSCISVLPEVSGGSAGIKDALVLCCCLSRARSRTVKVASKHHVPATACSCELSAISSVDSRSCCRRSRLETPSMAASALAMASGHNVDLYSARTDKRLPDRNKKSKKKNRQGSDASAGLFSQCSEARVAGDDLTIKNFVR